MTFISITKKLGWKLVPLIFGLLAAFIFFVLVGIIGDPQKSFKAAFLCTALIFGVGVFFLGVWWWVVFVHELGHYVAAQIVRFRTYGFRISTMEISRLTAGVRLRKVETKFRGGGGVLFAADSLQNIVSRFRCVVVGGPAASLLLAIGGFAVWHVTSLGQDWADPSWIFSPNWLPQLLIHFTLWTGLFSAMIFVEGLVPAVRKGQPNDAMLTTMSFRNKDMLMHQLIAAMIVVPWNYGVRARNWNREAIDILIELAPQPEQKARSLMVAYFHYADCDELPKANRYINEALSIVKSQPELLKQTLQEIPFEAAYALAYYQHRAADARAALLLVENKTPDQYSCFDRASAAILATEGKMEGARTAVESAQIRFNEKYPAPLEDTISLELDLLRRTVDRPLSVPVVAQ